MYVKRILIHIQIPQRSYEAAWLLNHAPSTFMSDVFLRDSGYGSAVACCQDLLPRQGRVRYGRLSQVSANVVDGLTWNDRSHTLSR